MKFEEYQEKLLQIEKWIKQSNTGSPKELAIRLKISERTVRRLLEKLKQQNPCIVFSRQLNSYIEK